MDNDQNNMQYDPNNAQNNMQYNPNNGQNFQGNGQNYQSNAQYNPNNTQYNTGNTQYDPYNAQYNQNNMQYDPNNMQYNPNHNTVTSQMNGSFGEVAQSGNTALGIIGMLVGALLGGAIWVLIGQMGYIVGWVGFFLIFASLKGYELLSRKKVDKKIVIISLILSLVVIFFADLMTYTVQLYREVNGYISFGECFQKVGTYIKEDTEAKTYFIRDLGLGYIFTIIASFTFLKNGLKRRVK